MIMCLLCGKTSEGIVCKSCRECDPVLADKINNEFRLRRRIKKERRRRTDRFKR